MKKPILLLLILAIGLSLNVRKGLAESGPERTRTIVTTDGEVDDMDSFIRLLLYSNEFDLEGLIYTSSQWHYAGDGKGALFTSEMPFTASRYGERTSLRWAGTQWMQGLIKKYASVYDNLLKHDKGYPSPEYLMGIVKIGNIDFEGEMSKDTEGSDFIKDILLDNRPGPVYIQIWGGTNTLARALKSIEDDYKGSGEWKDIYRSVSDKTIIYTILDQDATYNKYIAPNWPEIKVIYNSAQFWSFAYMWPMSVPQDMKVYLSGKWFSENIKFMHGPLLENYYLWGDGQKISGDPEHTQGDLQEAQRQQRNQYDFISEGDSPAFFFLLDYGLRSTDDPSFGGLGGRFIKSASNPARWEDGSTVVDYNPLTDKQDTTYPQVRWIPVLQNDFAARADWCVRDYEDANHAPVTGLNHSGNLFANPGEEVRLSGTAGDPDGDKLTYSWWQYMEAGTCKSVAAITGKDSREATVIIPSDAGTGETIHIVFEVCDSGTPELTRYQRVVISVK